MNFLERNMPPGTFEELCQLVKMNFFGFVESLPEEIGAIRKAIDKLQPKSEAPTNDKRSKLQLGITIYKQLGGEGFRALTRKSENKS